MKHQSWIDQHDTSVGQRRNLNLGYESNQWLTKHRDYRKGMGSISVDFFFVPSSCRVDQITNSNFYILL